jgi:hypothetical protein
MVVCDCRVGLYCRDHRYGASLLLDRRALLLATDRWRIQRAGARRIGRDGGVCLFGDAALWHVASEYAGIALDARQCGLHPLWRRFTRSRAHMAVGEPMDARHLDHSNARACRILWSIRHDRTGDDFVCTAVDDTQSDRGG